MSVVVTREPPNIWDEICKEFQLADPFRQQTKSKVDPKTVQFSSSNLHPALFDCKFTHNDIDANCLSEFQIDTCHPAFAGSLIWINSLSAHIVRIETLKNIHLKSGRKRHTRAQKLFF